ncbi:hypothetical protein CTAYLR_005989 [Chrysophaeum taylorii]|uniref:2-(3-amino-3-carboxypropyl)histidine synthase subunit 2 n=1 Tax=Chrysophaeum taylorii TaxID=2483200 RepID=A0AAD7XHF1_9STRA|nr:hypothetical protein CTAYLR_005989 [Chrysophaeum taylorii]
MEGGERLEYDRTVATIVELGARRVALQFPDSMMSEAPRVVWDLEERVPEVKFYVLGDCMRNNVVDAIGAAHVEAELIVHYGADCLAAPPEGCPPVLYVLAEEANMDVDGAAEAVVAALPGGDAPVLVLYDPLYRGSAGGVARALEARLGIGATVARLPDHVGGLVGGLPGLSVGGLVAPEYDEPRLRASRVVFVGAASTEVAMRCGACAAFAGYDPAARKTSVDAPTRLLARRQHQLQRASRAARWGVVVASAGRIELAARVARACEADLRAAGRSPYTLALCDPTPPKLANFGECEAFVVVGADAAVLSALGRESNVPVLSPHEMRVALGAQPWLPQDDNDRRPFYSNHLRDALLSGEGAEDDPPAAVDEDVPTFNLAEASLDDKRRQVTKPPRIDLAYDDGPLVVAQTDAIAFLRQREWRGLDPRVGDTPPGRAVEGRDGIASGYADEGGSSPTPTPTPLPPRGEE